MEGYPSPKLAAKIIFNTLKIASNLEQLRYNLKPIQWNSDITLPGYNAFPPFTLFFLGPFGKAH